MNSGCEIHFSNPTDDALRVRLAGEWKIGNALPSAGDMLKVLGITRLGFVILLRFEVHKNRGYAVEHFTADELVLERGEDIVG